MALVLLRLILGYLRKHMSDGVFMTKKHLVVGRPFTCAWIALLVSLSASAQAQTRTIWNAHGHRSGLNADRVEKLREEMGQQNIQRNQRLQEEENRKKRVEERNLQSRVEARQFLLEKIDYIQELERNQDIVELLKANGQRMPLETEYVKYSARPFNFHIISDYYNKRSTDLFYMSPDMQIGSLQSLYPSGGLGSSYDESDRAAYADANRVYQVASRKLFISMIHILGLKIGDLQTIQDQSAKLKSPEEVAQLFDKKMSQLLKNVESGKALNGEQIRFIQTAYKMNLLYNLGQATTAFKQGASNYQFVSPESFIVSMAREVENVKAARKSCRVKLAGQ